MAINTVQSKRRPACGGLKEAITRKWPEALGPIAEVQHRVFDTGCDSLDALFPSGGIPYGQLIEITGGVSSGKTGFLFRLLARWCKDNTVAYVDVTDSFFPDAAASAGVDLTRLLVVKPSGGAADRLQSSLRTAELLLVEGRVTIVLFDLVGRHAAGRLPLPLLHRLRLKTVRAKGLVVFLTQENSYVIPASMVSLRLTVCRSSSDTLSITVSKSRISVEGTRVETGS